MTLCKTEKDEYPLEVDRGSDDPPLPDSRRNGGAQRELVAGAMNLFHPQYLSGKVCTDNPLTELQGVRLVALPADHLPLSESSVLLVR